jgi:lycopene beta-cyclase
MSTVNSADLIIIGAGVAGLTLANKVLDLNPGINIVLIGREDNRSQRISFWSDGSDIAASSSGFAHRWNSWSFNHPRAGRVLQHAETHCYVSLDAVAYKESLRDSLIVRGCAPFIGEVSESIATSPTPRIRAGGHRWQAPLIVDTRTPKIPQSTLKQQFWGAHVELRQAHGLAEPVLMDFDTPAIAREGISFVYVLPLTTHQLLVEATTFSTQIHTESDYIKSVEAWLARHCEVTLAELPRVNESGILPMGPVVPVQEGLTCCGVAGGAARASTGYALQGIERQATRYARALAAGQQPLTQSPFSLRARLMDKVFLDVAKNQPKQLEMLFMAMAQRLSGDDFADFLSDTGGWMPCTRTVLAAPKSAFFRAALRLASGRA